jgi:hypothetical protein
MNIAIEN